MSPYTKHINESAMLLSISWQYIALRFRWTNICRELGHNTKVRKFTLARKY